MGGSTIGGPSTSGGVASQTVIRAAAKALDRVRNLLRLHLTATNHSPETQPIKFYRIFQALKSIEALSSDYSKRLDILYFKVRLESATIYFSLETKRYTK